MNAFMTELFLFHRGENKQAAEEIHSSPTYQTRNSLKTAHDIFESS